MSSRTLNLTENLYEYMLSVSVHEHDVQRELRERTARMSESQMQISPEQGQLMGFLTKLINAKKTIEIGVYTGYSALSVALALPEDGKIIACDKNESWTNIAKQFWKKANVEHKINLILNDALLTLDNLIINNEQGQYDLIFIDADKKNYDNYYEKALVLLRRGGIILIDNVLWSGAVADLNINDVDTVSIRELNRKIHSDNRVDITLLPIGDGLTMVRKI